VIFIQSMNSTDALVVRTHRKCVWANSKSVVLSVIFFFRLKIFSSAEYFSMKWNSTRKHVKWFEKWEREKKWPENKCRLDSLFFLFFIQRTLIWTDKNMVDFNKYRNFINGIQFFFPFYNSLEIFISQDFIDLFWMKFLFFFLLLLFLVSSSVSEFCFYSMIL